VNVSKTLEFRLKSGDTLTLDMSDALVESVMGAFNLQSPDQVTERHVKYYLTSAMKKTLEG
jgi:hypothetical protein